MTNEPEIIAVWTIEATVGTTGVNENVFRYAIIDREKAATADEAINLVGARNWRYTGGKFFESQSDVFAYESFAEAEFVGSEDDGAPVSFGPPSFSTREEAIEELSGNEC